MIQGLSFKYLILLCYILLYFGSMAFVYYQVKKHKDFREWLKGSFTNPRTKQACHKKIMAAILINVLCQCAIVAVFFPNHVLPEYFLVPFLVFIAALEGIDLAGKHKMFDNASTQQPNQPAACAPEQDTDAPDENQPHQK